MATILIIEDDVSIAEIEKDYLEINDYTVDICNDSITGLDVLQKKKYDLILLDVMLPGMDGFIACKKIRSVTDVPIIIVSAKHESGDQIMGLGLGADDFITKPFDPGVLVARVKAHLAQYERLNQHVMSEDCMECGPFVLDSKRRRITQNGNVLDLKNKEYEVLEMFIRNSDIVLTKDNIYEQVWGMDAQGDTTTVAVHVNRLRQKIEEDPSNPRYIQTVWSVGYRFSK